MKHTFKKLTAVAAVILLIAMCALPAAADETITVNGREVSVGDTVTYEFYIGELTKSVAGMAGSIFYDPACLEIVDGSIGFDVLKNAIYVIGDGSLTYAATNAIDGYDFEEDGLVITVAFEVLSTASGSAGITYEISEIFANDDNLTDIEANEYVITEKISTNSYTGTNSAPYLGEDLDDTASGSSGSSSSSASSSSSSGTSSSSSKSSSASSSTSSSGTSSSDSSSSKSSSVSSGTSSSGSSSASSGTSSSDTSSASSGTSSSGSSSASNVTSAGGDTTADDTDSLTDEQQLLYKTLEGVKNPDYTGTYDTADTGDTANTTDTALSEGSSDSEGSVSLSAVIAIAAGILAAALLIGGAVYFTVKKNK